MSGTPTDTAGPTASVLSEIAPGWAETSVNVEIHRKQALASGGGYQFAAFYDERARVVVARRESDGDAWTTATTPFTGDAEDPHNTINIALDGEGTVHLAWDHHRSPLRYARSLAAYGLEFGAPEAMLGEREDAVTYPEFHALPDGDLLLLYRDGGSGRGDAVLNRWRAREGRWSRVHDTLLDGEGERNAYWQAVVAPGGELHLAWVWRETPDVATNHDMHHAVSTDGGVTWRAFDGTPLAVPFGAESVPPALAIPEGSNLINQTSIAVAADGRPFVATHFRTAEEPVTQIRLIYPSADGSWTSSAVSAFEEDFELGGTGAKAVPVSRPLVLADPDGTAPALAVVWRDRRAGGRALIASADTLPDVGDAVSWHVAPLADDDLGYWEPVHDAARWRERGELDLLLQRVGHPEDPIVPRGVGSTVSVLRYRPTTER